ncbi:amino acid transporter [Hymenopellis radicata]|nr:amino acid transporter [Hymenopellis radicata]
MSPSKDEDVLAALGYKQELKRHFSWFELVGLSFTIIGVVPSIAAVLVFSIPYGGPVSMIWGWLVASVFLVCIALALAELGSAQPTYINTITYVSAVASGGYALSVLIMSAASIGRDTFAPTTGQTYALMVAVLVSEAVVSSMATRVVARLQSLFVVLNVGLFLGIIIALPAATPSEFKNSPSFVFGSFQNLSLWPDGFAFILSFIAPAWVIAGLDASVHISEEAKNAGTAVPKAIILSAVISALLGWAVNIALGFNMGPDLELLLSDPIEQPMSSILFHAFGQKGMLIFWTFIIITLLSHGALPMSRVFYRLNKHTGTPVNCTVACASGASLLGLLMFASPAAINAVFTIPVICQYVTFTIPIMARFLAGKEFVPGPFSLGTWVSVSAYISLIAFVASSFMTFMAVVLFFPLEPHPLVDEMNYGVVVFMGVVTLSMAYYFFPVYGGRYWFTGPVSTINYLNPNGKERARRTHTR